MIFLISIEIGTQVQSYLQRLEVKLQDFGFPIINLFGLSLLQLPDSLLLDFQSFDSIIECIQVILFYCNLFHAFRLTLLNDLV